MDIVSRVLPIPCSTPAWYRQHANLLVIANGFCWYSGSASELANRQWSFHGRSSLCDFSAQKGTRSTGWKVKGDQAKKLLTKHTTRYCRCSRVVCHQIATASGHDGDGGYVDWPPRS